MTHLPPNLPTISDARLPATYERARAAIAECARVDECQKWGDQAEVLASYARQARDDEMRKMADRIQARAIRRCGELLKQIERANGTRTDLLRDGSDPRLTRTKAATDAGLSERQRKTALRVSNVPDHEFEEAVESNDPPTLTALADRGKKPQPKPLVDLQGRNEVDFYASTQGQGHLREFAQFCERTEARTVAKGALPQETKTIRKHIAIIDGWLDKLSVSLEG